MPESPPPTQSLARAREQKINELSQHFANDDLSLDDLERRIERVYKASSVADVELITADLRVAAPLVDQRGAAARTVPVDSGEPLHAVSYETPKSRLVAIMS